MQNDYGPNEIVPDPPLKPDADVALLRRAATRLAIEADAARFKSRRRRGAKGLEQLKADPLFTEAIERARARLREEGRDDQAQKLMVLWEHFCTIELAQALRGIATLLDTGEPPLRASGRATPFRVATVAGSARGTKPTPSTNRRVPVMSDAAQDGGARPVRDEGQAFGSAPSSMKRGNKSWTVTFRGRKVVIHSNLLGLTDIARLLERCGEPLAAAELFGSRREGDLGAALDSAGVDELRDAIEVARADGNVDDAESLEKELAKRQNIRGKPRKLGDPLKKARDAVRNRIKRAMRAIEDGIPELHRFLKDRIEMGDPYRIEVRESDPPWFVRHQKN